MNKMEVVRPAPVWDAEGLLGPATGGLVASLRKTVMPPRGPFNHHPPSFSRRKAVWSNRFATVQPNGLINVFFQGDHKRRQIHHNAKYF